MRLAYLVVGLSLIGVLPALPATAQVVEISAGPTGNGCTTCFGGPPALGSAPGMVVTLDNEGTGPLQRTLAAGTYSITNAATSGNYSGWRYDGGNDWAWNFVIGTDNGNNTATLLKVGSVGGPHYSSQSEVASATDVPTYSFGDVLDPHGSTAGYYDTFTLAKATTLDFFVIDGYLGDNVGGVALDISPLATGAPEPGTWAMLIGGFALVGSVMRQQRRGLDLRLTPA